MYSFSENSGVKLSEQEALVFQFLLQKCLSLFLWYIRNYYWFMSKISHWDNLTFLGSKTIGFIRIGFTNWDLWSFSQSDLLQDCSEQQSCTACHVSLVHLLSLIFFPRKKSVISFIFQDQNYIQYIHFQVNSRVQKMDPIDRPPSLL